MSLNPEDLEKLRPELLQLPCEQVPWIHGWLLGVACAIERKYRLPTKYANRLIGELRRSKELRRFQSEDAGARWFEP